MARPFKKLDLGLVESLAEIHCTIPEIAHILGVSTDTLHRRAQKSIDRGKARGKESLRRLQWKAAQKGNATILIWLGKNVLGQRDRFEDESHASKGIPMLKYALTDSEKKRKASNDGGED
jgi:hypothetical protein